MKKTAIFLILATIISTSCQNKIQAPGNLHSVAQSAASYMAEPNQIVTNPRQLTFTGPRSGEGYFSADGNKMIFQSEREPGNPFYQMFILDLISGKTQRVSPGKGKTTCGWIHPSGKKVMWSSTHLDSDIETKSKEEYESRKKTVKARYSWSYDEHFDIFSSDLNGRHLQRLTRELGYDAEGAYSPDGKYIVFASNRTGYTEKLSPEDEKRFKQDASYMMDIYIMNSDGTNVKRLTTAKGYDGGPFFSADGRKITWRRFSPAGDTAEIYSMNIDGSEQKQLTHLKSMSWAPFYHPSGDYIIFASSVLGYSNFELFIVDSQGKQSPVRVTFSDGFDGLATFTPDGHQMSWTHRNEKGESQISIADWDDAMARKLLKLSPQELRPDGLHSEVSINDIKNIIYYLASDVLGGRRTGASEEKIYTQKIADLFKSWGLVGGGPNGSYFQSFEFTSGVSLGQKNSFEFVGQFQQKVKVQEDYLPLSFSPNGQFHEAPIFFAGYGIKAPATDKLPAYDSYKGADVKGKWILLFKDIPENVSPERRHQLNMYARIQHKLTVAKNEGAIGIIVVSGPQGQGNEKFDKLKFEGALSEGSLPVIRLKTKIAQALFAKSQKDLSALQIQLDRGEQIEGFVLPSTYAKAHVDLIVEKSQGVNVLAKISTGGQQAVLIGAHGDHLGHGEVGSSLAKSDEQGKTHYGADDNASGVAGVLELAHYFAMQNKQKPQMLKKDLYFAVWSGEEIGVLGSAHFAKDWGKISKRKFSDYFAANLNMDMIGRLRDRLMVQGVGSGDHWTQIFEEIGLKTALPMTLQEDPHLPTDSMALYLAGIPAISFFTGSHAEYHTPRDTAELINYQGTAKVIEVVRQAAMVLADNSVQLVKYVKVAGNNQSKLEGRTFRVYVGTIPDYTQEGVKGLKISGVSKESPAEKAGLKEKDIIVEFAGTKIENIYDYVYTLQSVKPNQPTKVKVRRGDQILEFSITPALKE